MANKRILFFVAVALVAIVLAGCASSTGRVDKVGWAEYTQKPSKDYTVVGAINIKVENEKTLNYELMAEAIKLGGHDILNVRVDLEQIDTKQIIRTASAVVIKYTAESLKNKSSDTAIGQGGTKTTSDETYILGGSSGGSSAPAGGKKKVLGIF